MSNPVDRPDVSNFDKNTFDKKTLIPIFALVGLGADGLSSSCYGPEEAFLALGHFPHLILFVAFFSILTIAIISISYCQIVELFPRGGGGYLVATTLLSPFAGVVAGCALLVDYVLTIAISIASGVDAIYSLFPSSQHGWIIEVKVVCIAVLILLNLRGVKESVLPWIPIFVLFCVTHIAAFIWSFIHHWDRIPQVLNDVQDQTLYASSTLGKWGLILLLLRSFSMGAGTFTGIEAVSNGMSLIREPRVKNAKRTMLYIAISLSLAVFGLVSSFLIVGVYPKEGQTINAVLFHAIGGEMGGVWTGVFPAITLFSETALLFIAAETGFLGGPQIMSNMALDRWFPHKFVTLSDRYVMRHGVILMGAAAIAVMLYTYGSVNILVVLYSLSVFITFSLSQTGMAIYWYKKMDRPGGVKKFFFCALGALLSILILISLSILKFEQGAWLTLLVVGILILTAIAIKTYYTSFMESLSKIYRLIPHRKELLLPEKIDRQRTAVILGSGFTGFAQHTIANVISLFGRNFDHFIFMHVGLIDAGNFKGEHEIEGLNAYVLAESNKLVKLMQDKGYTAEAAVSIGTDVVDEIEKLAREIMKKNRYCVFFGGQLVLPKETFVTRWLHNQTLWAIQRRMLGIQFPFVVIPLYLKEMDHKIMSIRPIAQQTIASLINRKVELKHIQK